MVFVLLPSMLIGFVLFGVYGYTGDTTWAMWACVNLFIALIFAIYLAGRG